MKTTLLFTFILTTTLFSRAQAPCGTNFTGFDPCSAEFLGTASTCANATETFQTNTCNGTLPTTGGCGMTTGTDIVWGKFTVTTADTYTITWTASNGRNIRLGLYQFTDPCTMAGETQVACANAGGNGVDETISTFLTPGIYYVCGKSSGDLSAASEICVHAPSVPPPVVASDCGVGVDICTNLSFMIDPNGEGTNTTEIPASGSLGNPLYDGTTTLNPWGTTNMGCLQIDESNSTWMKVNISGGGNLEFTFGGNGTQAGFYDWIMYPAGSTCGDILAHTEAPARCNWNLVDNGGTGLADVIPAGGDAGNFEPSLPVNAGDIFIICFSNYSSVQTAVPLEFGGTALVSCTPLPVQFSGLNAVPVLSEGQQSVNVIWNTVTEKNSAYFVVEHSLDGDSFKEIGEVDAAGMSDDILSYEFMDRNASVNAINYYRLKQVDTDGSFDYTYVVSTVLSNQSRMSVFPNPTTGKVSITTGKNNTDLLISLNTLSGTEIRKIYTSSSHGLCSIDLSDVPRGSYLLEIHEGQNTVRLERIVLK